MNDAGHGSQPEHHVGSTVDDRLNHNVQARVGCEGLEEAQNQSLEAFKFSVFCRLFRLFGATRPCCSLQIVHPPREKWWNLCQASRVLGNTNHKQIPYWHPEIGFHDIPGNSDTSCKQPTTIYYMLFFAPEFTASQDPSSYKVQSKHVSHNLVIVPDAVPNLETSRDCSRMLSERS